MSIPRRRLEDRITSPEFLENLHTRSIEELRSMRQTCQEAETELAFQRTLCMARIDILSAELERRQDGDERDLMDRLPEILAAAESGADPSSLPDRAPGFSMPRTAGIERRRVEETTGEDSLARLFELKSPEIKAALDELREQERNVAAKHAAVLQVLESVESEMVRHYASGAPGAADVLG